MVRLMHLNSSFDHIKNFLIEEKIVKKEEYVGAATDNMKAEVTYLTLKRALEEEKVMLADFEWIILPKEQIRITIVTPDIHKEFSFGF